jgi:two-component system sensor histidine kinase KdpD
MRVRSLALAGVSLVTGFSSAWYRHLDLSARERALAERERELDARREAVLELLSHELRTPLFVISGAVETLASGRLPCPEDAAALTAAVRDAAARLERRTATVLAAGGRPPAPPELESVRAAALVQQVIDRLGSRRADRVRVSVAPEDLVLEVDERYARVALLELIDNALRFGGGEPVDVVVRLDEAHAVFEVSDAGPTPRVQHRWFDPFHREHATPDGPKDGLGLGLTAASRLIRHLGGGLELCSREPAGITAVVRLPAATRVVDA